MDCSLILDCCPDPNHRDPSLVKMSRSDPLPPIPVKKKTATKNFHRKCKKGKKGKKTCNLQEKNAKQCKTAKPIGKKGKNKTKINGLKTFSKKRQKRQKRQKKLLFTRKPGEKMQNNKTNRQKRQKKMSRCQCSSYSFLKMARSDTATVIPC